MLATTIAACSAGGGDPDADRQPDPGVELTTQASPALAAELPDGFVPAAASVGDIPQFWGDDTRGNDAPLVVLAPEGESPEPDNIVVISLTGFEGQQGGLRQSASGYGESQALTVEGQPAFLTTGPPPRGERDREPWDELVAKVGDDVAVRVTAPPGAYTPEALAELVTATRLSEPVDAEVGTGVVYPDPPQVPDPPFGLTVVGDATAAAVLGPLAALAPPDSSEGLAGTFTTVYSGEGEKLGITTLPGEALDPWATIGMAREIVVRDLKLGSLDGRPAAWFTQGSNPERPDRRPPTTRVVVTLVSWGDAVVVATERAGGELMGRDDLAAVAAGLQRASIEEWRGIMEGREFGPDPGATELVRRTTDGGTEWLVQVGAPPNSGGPTILVDDGRRVRALSAGTVAGPGSGPTRISFAPPFDGSDPELPNVVATVVDAPSPAVALVVQRPDCTTERVDLAEGPVRPGQSGPLRYGVATGPRSSGEGRCPPPPGESMDCYDGLALVDAQGGRVACV